MPTFTWAFLCFFHKNQQIFENFHFFHFHLPAENPTLFGQLMTRFGVQENRFIPAAFDIAKFLGKKSKKLGKIRISTVFPFSSFSTLIIQESLNTYWGIGPCTSCSVQFD